MRIAIVGGSGKMGRWFARFLLKEGQEVIITGRDKRKLLEAQQQLGVEVATNVEAVKRADAVLVSVPLDNFERVIEEVSPHIKPEHVVIDITSVKVLPVEVMHRHIKTGLVLGTHPMFGPGARDIREQNFVLTPTDEAEETLAQIVWEYLEARGARVTSMTPRQHDELMTVILGLSHFIGLVSADTLASCDNLDQMNAVSGTTYRLLLTLVKSVISEDPEFYASLQTSLPNMAEIEKLFGTKAKVWADLVEKKDRSEFINRMNALKDRLGKIV